MHVYRPSRSATSSLTSNQGKECRDIQYIKIRIAQNPNVILSEYKNRPSVIAFSRNEDVLYRTLRMCGRRMKNKLKFMGCHEQTGKFRTLILTHAVNRNQSLVCSQQLELVN